ncbi:hypothetical protein Ddc_22780 [Ditylenchus destructor]|nr:hypothetical protein Ddc_22780 [Ditylenchus destructor]
MMLSFLVIVALMPVMVLSTGETDHSSDLKTRIDETMGLITEAKLLVPELQEGNAAGKNEVTSELKKQAEKLESVTEELTSKMEQLPKDKKKEAVKGLKDALSKFKKPLKQFIKKVQKQLTESDNNSAPDDNDSCPAPNVMNSMLKEKTDKAKQEIQELKTSAARRKRYASRKLKIKRALSFTIGLPVHIIFAALCLVNMPIGKIGHILPLWMIFPIVLRIVSYLILFVSTLIESLVIPKEDAETFQEALEIKINFDEVMQEPVANDQNGSAPSDGKMPRASAVNHAFINTGGSNLNNSTSSSSRGGGRRGGRGRGNGRGKQFGQQPTIHTGITVNTRIRAGIILSRK